VLNDNIKVKTDVKRQMSIKKIMLVNQHNFLDFYFRTVHIVMFILFKPTHALFLKHIHIHI